MLRCGDFNGCVNSLQSVLVKRASLTIIERLYNYKVVLYTFNQSTSCS